MKKQLFIFAAALALVGCSSNSYEGDLDPFQKGTDDSSIVFTFGKSNNTMGAPMRRVGEKTGAEAAATLGGKFYVLGTKTADLQDNTIAEKIVFDNYVVVWEDNTAGTTASNTCDWDYVGKTSTGAHLGTISGQTIKYWDYSASQYDFIAFSVGANALVTGDAASNSVKGTAIAIPNAANSYQSFTLTAATVADLAECYYTDVVTIPNANFGNPVQLIFKNLTAKIRLAFYEEIPGYTVSNLQFYQDATTATGTLSGTGVGNATLFTTGSDKLSTAGAITVSYPVVGATAKAASPQDVRYNKASVSVDPDATNATTTQSFGTVNYATGDVLATAASDASMAGASADHYFIPVLPAAGHALTLRVNYTLTSVDGSGETINVYGATAVIDAAHTNWKPNYAYTYIFKISNNTNGLTNASQADKVGLFPITFDAVVESVDQADFNQETITTVATPSVTTYAFNNSNNKVIAAYGAGNEYPAAATTDIYVSVEGKTDISTGTLYTVTKGAPAVKYDATEAEIISALQMNGRNGVILTAAAPAAVYTTTSIPTEDGNGITVPEKSVAKFTATATATTYAFVYKVADGTTTYLPTDFSAGATKPTGFPTGYYKDNAGTKEAAVDGDWNNTAAQTFYIANNGNTYAVKVIKTY